MTLKKNYFAIAFLLAAGVMSPIAVAMQPLTCEVLEEKRTSSIKAKKEKIDTLPEYDEQYEEVEAKNDCMADLGEIMSSSVGGGSVLGQLSDFLGDTLSNKACEFAKKKAQEARRKAEEKVNETIDNVVNEARSSIEQNIPTSPINVSTPSTQNTGNGNLSSIYDQLGSMF